MALAAPLLACSATGELAPRTVAPSANQHFIGVSVQPGPVRVVVTVPTLTVHGQNHVIFWDLHNAAGQSYRFAADGIAFKTPAGRSQFTCRRLTDARFQCLDQGTVAGTFEYGVKVEDATATLFLDPLVVNN
jgi:hypothetical protein